MKVFTAYSCLTNVFDVVDVIDCAVVANTKSEALGLLLDVYPTTVAKDWHLSEVDVNKVGIYGA